MPPTRVDKETVTRAVEALYKRWNKREKKDKELVEDEETFSLVFGLRRFPEAHRNKPHSIPIPHSLLNPELGAETCLFVKDPASDLKSKLVKKPVKGLKKIISYTKLRQNYSQYADRRLLCASYDAFFADDRILPMLPKKLGKVFFQKKKHPIPVRVSRDDISGALESARDSTQLYLGWGACTAVRVGFTNFPKEHVIENIMAVLEPVAAKIPKKWKSIQSIHLKTTNSLALPIYNALPEMMGRPAMAEATLSAVPRADMVSGGGGGGGGGGGSSDDSDSDSDDSGADTPPPAPVATKKKSAGASKGAKKGSAPFTPKQPPKRKVASELPAKKLRRVFEETPTTSRRVRKAVTPQPKRRSTRRA